MTRVERHLADLIRAQGPISVATFMTVVLGHPEYGYYSVQRPFGKKGDFTTSPEISQVFGELIGLWSVQVWGDLGKPSPFNFVELGPGRGVLMADALRAISQVAPDFIDAAHIHLVETSRRLRHEQAQRLPKNIQWQDRFDQVPKAPTIVIANEFFDALPIHQYVLSGDGWRERLVECDDTPEGTAFRFTDSPLACHPEIAITLPTQIGDIVEVSSASLAIVTELAGVISTFGGAGLFVDYGSTTRGVGDTLQAVRNHQHHPVLKEIGMADLTAHVDFESLAEAAVSAGTTATRAIEQRVFLERLGIHHRAETLCRGKDPQTSMAIHQDIDRLIAPDKMGALFKVMAIAGSKDLVPAGFEGTDIYGDGGQSSSAQRH